MSDEDTSTTEPGTDGQQEGDGTEQLGDAGKQALDRMKDERNKARSDLKSWTALARELGAKTPEDLKALIAGKQQAADEADPDRIRREATAEATAKANARIVRAEIKALAAGKFADPADAVAFLDLTEFEVDDDGEVDSEAITAALTDLLSRKPHLAASGTRRFQGGADGGHRGEPAPVDTSPRGLISAGLRQNRK